MSETERTVGFQPTRRQLLALGAGAFCVAVVPFARRTRRRLVRRQVPVMGTIADLAVVSEDEARAHAALDAGVAALRSVDRTMSRFDPRSDVGRINAAGGRAAVHIHAATALVIQRALEWAQATGGAFDPCLGQAVELWDVNRRRVPPDRRRVERLAGRRLFRSIELDGRRLRLTDPLARIDLGGIAKGYGVDLAAGALRNHGVQDGLVNVGGDLVTLGNSEDGDPWQVGVRDPVDPARIVRTLSVSDQAVATSGDSEQFFRHGGERYHHLLDPGTGAPRRSDEHSLTVIADRCIDADAAATAWFGLPESARSTPPAAAVSSVLA